MDQATIRRKLSPSQLKPRDAGEEVVFQVAPDRTCLGDLCGTVGERYQPWPAALGPFLCVPLGMCAGDSDRRERILEQTADAEGSKLRPAQAGQAEELGDRRKRWAHPILLFKGAGEFFHSEGLSVLVRVGRSG